MPTFEPSIRSAPLPLRPPRAVILLAAGSGSRMGALTRRMPKALLPIPGDARRRCVLDVMLEAVAARHAGEIVVVCGFQAAAVQQHLSRQDMPRVRLVHNPDWSADVNIASVARGVAALTAPHRGYLIVETDLLLAESAWDHLLETLAVSPDSFWVTHGRYGPHRTGGVVHARADGWIDAVDYQPTHNPACDGWPKMLGLLAVGPKEVATDIFVRQQAMRQGIGQYYLTPWIQGVRTGALRARVLALDGHVAATFNTADQFTAACQSWQARQSQGTHALAAPEV